MKTTFKKINDLFTVWTKYIFSHAFTSCSLGLRYNVIVNVSFPVYFHGRMIKLRIYK